MDDRLVEAFNRGNLAKLLEKVRDDRGLDLTQYRPRYVERRVGTRLRVLDLKTYRQYAAYLDEHPEEYVKLLDTLTINVTQFFRDPSVYETFRSEIIPALVKAKKQRHQRTIRVWSAGCATGQEPYSLAMSFLTELRRESGFLLLVFGTDIDRTALATAQRAVYPIADIEQIPPVERARYTVPEGDTFSIRPEVTRLVKFEYLNLFEDKPIHLADVIFCRNVFIYFTREEQERMLNAFWNSLSRGGYLVLGRSERLAPSLAGRFELVSGRERIYRKPRNRQESGA